MTESITFTVVYILLSYLIGGIPVGYLITKAFAHRDITKIGSGNIGATNVFRLLGWRLAIPVFLLDVFKGALPVMVTLLAFPDILPLVMVATLAGNIFSPYLGFRGGKGVGTSAGVLMVIFPLPVIVAIMGTLLLIKVTTLVSLSSLITALALCLYLFVISSWPLRLAVICMLLLIIFAHRENIIRLMQKKEKPIERIQNN